jgi:hypothetical protein
MNRILTFLFVISSFLLDDSGDLAVNVLRLRRRQHVNRPASEDITAKGGVMLKAVAGTVLVCKKEQ